jgi:crotonobetainyl-CoA:carnitine CoA-transferase CaiB-like acyl-CoA transferase
MGKYFTVAPPYKLSKVGYEIRPAPLMGEHNEHVFKQILGMSDDDIADLIADGVVE